MEKKFKGTQKPQEIIKCLGTLVASINNEGISGSFESSVFNPIEQKAHDELFLDALNTIQKCDLMPSEILEQRNELIELIQGDNFELAKAYINKMKEA